MLDRKNFAQEAELVSQWVQNYLKNIESFPVKSQVQPKEVYHQIPEGPPLESEDLETILHDLNEIILPGITHWQHPNYHAYFNANSSVESLLAEHITTAIAAQCMIWETSPAAAELEERMMEWLRDNMSLALKAGKV
jgi:aromatic-L-amino-acid decarboxylase